MWKDESREPVWEFLGWLFLVWGLCKIVIIFLEPHSIAFAEGGPLTAGYVIYAIVGILFSTPSPMIATYITLKRHRRINSVKDFCRLIFHTPNIKKTIFITLVFCAAAFGIALIYGTPTDSPWYMLIVALPVMIIGGGVEEIGWRGFLQPALEKRFPFPAATTIVAAIWISWHIPLWFLSSSNHYGDSFIGFAIYFFVWAFLAAAIYKATKSVFACVMYHAFINAIGAIYDWNALFDAFPNRIGIYTYYLAILVAAIAIWRVSDQSQRISKEVKTTDQEYL